MHPAPANAAFSCKPTNPAVVTGSFHFPANDPIYADHFPDIPIVPGTLIIHAFVTAVKSNKALRDAMTLSRAYKLQTPSEERSKHTFAANSPATMEYNQSTPPDLNVLAALEVHNFRFKRFVSPGIRAYVIEIKTKEFICRLYSSDRIEGRPAATGVLRWNS